MPNLVWFRNDLRTLDHPALSAAAEGDCVGAVYCMSLEQWRKHDMGDWRLAFQLRALRTLADSLSDLQIPLHVLTTPRFADIPQGLVRLCQQWKVGCLHFIDEYPLNERRRDEAVAHAMEKVGVSVHRHIGDVLVEPGRLRTGSGQPYTVFTPFYRKWQQLVPAVLAERQGQPRLQSSQGQFFRENQDLCSVIPDELDSVPNTLGESLWPAGEHEALAALQRFLDGPVLSYHETRDIPSVPGTSNLSAHLAVGAVSPRQCVHQAQQVLALEPNEGAEKWIAEIAWRDFYRNIAGCFDHVSMGQSFRVKMDQLPWRHAPDDLAAWQAGQTGYAFVDAAMRQLNETGWMHNRLRMLAAMFLSKHLLIDWREGERYFMKMLVDGDFASNNGGWQWSAATGTDAAPYFRIFNPASQGRKFDPDGVFTRHYVPELAQVSNKALFDLDPPASNSGDLFGAVDYPKPIVEHSFARARALDFYKVNL